MCYGGGTCYLSAREDLLVEKHVDIALERGALHTVDSHSCGGDEFELPTGAIADARHELVGDLAS